MYLVTYTVIPKKFFFAVSSFFFFIYLHKDTSEETFFKICLMLFHIKWLIDAIPKLIVKLVQKGP